MPDLPRFFTVQEPIYAAALAELEAGRKHTHWMWFVFPQVTGLGSSDMSRRYALAGLDEARQYLAHPVLGARLRECTEAVLRHAQGSGHPLGIHDIFGSPDDMKFHSSMTLFHRAAPAEPLFARALETFFAGAEDAATLARL